MSRELTNVSVQKISLVKKAANGEEVTIYKSAENPNQEPETPATVDNGAPAPEVDNAGVPGEVQKSAEEPVTATQEPTVDENITLVAKFAEAIKNIFGGKETKVAKSTDIPYKTDYNSFESLMNNPRLNINDALYTLEDAIWNIFWDDSIDNGKELILKNIDDFRAYVVKVLDQPVEVQKSAFQKPEKIEKGSEDEVKPEDIKAMLEPIQKSIEGLSTKIEALEKSAEPTKEPEAVAEGTTEPVVKSAEADPVATLLTEIKKSVDGLGDRVNTLEQFRGISNQSEQTKVEKSDDQWSGVLNGLV